MKMCRKCDAAIGSSWCHCGVPPLEDAGPVFSFEELIAACDAALSLYGNCDDRALRAHVNDRFPNKWTANMDAAKYKAVTDEKITEIFKYFKVI